MSATVQYRLVRIAGPVTEPVSLDVAKLHCRVDIDDDDDLIESDIKAAREYCEEVLGQSIVEQTWQMSLDCFPAEVFVPRPPLMSVESIAYYDIAEELQTLDSSSYYVDTFSKPGRIIPVDSWPTTQVRPNAITITFRAGHNSAAVPESYRKAIKMLVGHWYENREAAMAGSVPKMIDLAVESLLATQSVGTY